MATRPDRTQPLRVWLEKAPFSPDPIHYDAFIHHIAWTSVLGTLFTQYRLGEVQGLLAESWSVQPGQKIWTVKLRSGLRFADGEPITANAVVRSLTRTARLMSKSSSRSGVFERLVGYGEFSKGATRLKGIVEQENSVSFHFSTPFPDFPKAISFGIYAIASPSDYDHTSLTWKGRSITASGPYRVKAWNDTELILDLRSDFPRHLLHPDPFKSIEVRWDPDSRLDSDVVSGANTEIRPLELGYIFQGGIAANIAYLRCNSWKIAGSPCFGTTQRKLLRDTFYSELAKLGLTPPRTFFPKVMLGDLSPTKLQESSLSPAIETPPIRFRPFDQSFLPFAQNYEKAMSETAAIFGTRAVRIASNKATLGKEFNSDLSSYTADISAVVTGILVEDPDEDIRFMFRSSEGIRLPDFDGTISPLLDKHPIDSRAVDERLWDQAIIWPISHLALGLWAKPDVDFGFINTLLPPTSFHLIGWKK